MTLFKRYLLGDYSIDEFSMNESVFFINTESYKEILNRECKNIQTKDKLVNELNRVFNNRNIKFIHSISKITKNQAELIKKTGLINVYVDILFWLQYKKNFKVWVEYFIRIMEHELIHREQFNKVNFKNYKDVRRYSENTKNELSNIHEIMAYSKIIVDDIKKYYSHTDASILNFLRNPISNISYVFDDYISLFGKNNKIIKRLYKYMYEYIITGKTGKD